MRLARRDWRPPPLVLAIVATIGAAGLVFYLQQRAMSALQSQNEVIVRQLAEQTATDLAVELRRTLDGPIFDTLAAVNHPELRAGRFDLVAQQFARGLEAYPHVDRFFAWSATSGVGPVHVPDVLFYGRSGEFVRDPDLGEAVLDLAERYASTQQIYVAADDVGQEPRQVLLRLFWTDARRLEYFAVLGFVIDPTSMRERLFAGARGRAFDTLLLRRGGDLPLQVRVTDEDGALVYGTLPPGVPAAHVSFPMLFYPADTMRSRLAAGVTARPWTIEVGAPAALEFAGAGQRYWPLALSMLLMLAALGLTVQAHRRSAELARMQTDFVAHVSHQLKTPLSLLSAATETLQMDRIRSPEKLAEYLDTIRAEAARLTALVQRVLEFSRVQEQRRYEFEQVALGALVRETVDAFAHGLPGHRARFEVVLSSPGPFVRADPAALEQVVANLLDNAVKYSDRARPVTVTVRAERLNAIVEVTDRGVGIAPAERSRIFERFYRAPGSAHRQGFGLGLPIVRELVHGQGGRVEVSSELGVGTTFRVTLQCISGPVTREAPPLRLPEAAS
jgi:signal transduction histidine kinase